MKKVLIILYYWPPSGGGGVQRWVKFTKYLPDQGWEPIVYAPENADYAVQDESLQDEISKDLVVVKHPIWEPYNLYQGFLGKKKKAGVNQAIAGSKTKRSWKENLSIWIRGNFFIPDARKFWIKPSVKFLKQYLKENPVDAIVTTGPPHSLHLIGRKLKKETGVKWIADFRDPWTKIEFYHELKLSKRSDAKHKRLEKAVVREADAIVSVAWTWKKEHQEWGAQFAEVITNGYDSDDFPDKKPPCSDSFQLSHIGTFAHDRDPRTLWEVLSELCTEVPGFREELEIQLIGKTDQQVFASLNDFGLSKNLSHIDYVQHSEAVDKMMRSQVLLLLLNQVEYNAVGRPTGKIYEYLAAERPILCIGPEVSDPGTILEMTNGGDICNFGDKPKMKKLIMGYYNAYKNGSLVQASDEYQQFSRRNTTAQLAEILNMITE